MSTTWNPATRRRRRGCGGSRRRTRCIAIFDEIVRSPAVLDILHEADRPRPAAARLQAQHEVGPVRLAGRMAPGLGVLPAHQRRHPGDRRAAGRHRPVERPDAGHARHASRPGLEPPCRGRPLRRPDRPRPDPGRDRPRGALHGTGRQHVVPPCARAARLGAEHLGPAAQPAALRGRRERRLAAAGREGLRRVRQPPARRPVHGHAAA